MPGTIKHRKPSTVPDNPDYDVSSSEWNDALVGAEGADGDLMRRDVAALDGWSLTSTVPPAQGGTGAGPLAAHGVVLAQGAAPMTAVAPGSAGQVLMSNGASADPSWQPASTPGTHRLRHATGGADAPQNLSAAILTSGTLPDARLSAQIPRLASNNLFSGDQTLEGATFARLLLRDLSRPANQRNFHVMNFNGVLTLQALDDALAGSGGSLVLERAGAVRVSGDLYEKGRSQPLGHWTQIVYTGVNFSSNVGSWTVEPADQVQLQYMLAGKTLWLAFQLQQTTVAGSPSQLRVALPLSLTAAFPTWVPFHWFDAGVWNGTGVATAAAGGGYLALQKDPGAGVAWVNGTNTVWVYGTVPIAVS